MAKLYRMGKTFIADVREWLRMDLAVDYYTIQALTGHGIFASYPKNIRKLNEDEYWLGYSEPDTPMHTLFKCKRTKTAGGTSNREHNRA